MDSIYVNNFVGSYPLEVGAHKNPTCGPLVTIKQSIGSCYFQHSMKPDQARALAAALIEGADELDGAEIAVRCLASECETA